MRLIDFEKQIIKVKSIHCFSKINLLDFSVLQKNHLIECLKTIDWVFDKFKNYISYKKKKKKATRVFYCT